MNAMNSPRLTPRSMTRTSSCIKHITRTGPEAQATTGCPSCALRARLMYAERELPRFGPPDNPSHLREWTLAEFNRTVAGRYLAIERHELSNRIQGTQLIIARPLGN